MQAQHKRKFLLMVFKTTLHGARPLVKKFGTSLHMNPSLAWQYQYALLTWLFIVGEPITNYSCCQGDAGSPGCCVGKVLTNFFERWFPVHTAQSQYPNVYKSYSLTWRNVYQCYFKLWIYCIVKLWHSKMSYMKQRNKMQINSWEYTVQTGNHL